MKYVVIPAKVISQITYIVNKNNFLFLNYAKNIVNLIATIYMTIVKVLLNIVMIQIRYCQEILK
jgi:hypothetical protein